MPPSWPLEVRGGGTDASCPCELLRRIGVNSTSPVIAAFCGQYDAFGEVVRVLQLQRKRLEDVARALQLQRERLDRSMRREGGNAA